MTPLPTPTPIHPGIWHLSVGEPEAITKVSLRELPKAQARSLLYRMETSGTVLLEPAELVTALEPSLGAGVVDRWKIDLFNKKYDNIWSIWPWLLLSDLYEAAFEGFETRFKFGFGPLQIVDAARHGGGGRGGSGDLIEGM